MIHNYIIMLAYAYLEVQDWHYRGKHHSRIVRTIDYNNVVWC